MTSPIVAIRCTAYNHEAYIRDALEGFVMQKTNFPFVAIVHDDASTDGTAAIIREYAEKYPDIIKPIFENENQYSKGDGSFTRIMDDALKSTGAKYIAMCEGDDYWIDPLKLQKQVDFLESHPDYSMCTSNILIEDKSRKKSPSTWNTKSDENLSIRNIILNGGLYIGTGSILMRAAQYYDRPMAVKALHIGDYPLQIYMASVGNVKNLKDITCVYRYMSEGSWTQKNINARNSTNWLNQYFVKEQNLLDTMDKVTNHKYHKYFKERSSIFRFECFSLLKPSLAKKAILRNPMTIFRRFSLKLIIFVLLPPSIQKMIFNHKKRNNSNQYA